MRLRARFGRLRTAWIAIAAIAVLAVPWLPRQALYVCPSGTVDSVCCCGLSAPVRSGCCDVISVASASQPAPAAEAPAAPAPLALPPIARIEWPPIVTVDAQVALPVPRGPPPRAVPAFIVWSAFLT